MKLISAAVLLSACTLVFSACSKSSETKSDPAATPPPKVARYESWGGSRIGLPSLDAQITYALQSVNQNTIESNPSDNIEELSQTLRLEPKITMRLALINELWETSDCKLAAAPEVQATIRLDDERETNLLKVEQQFTVEAGKSYRLNFDLVNKGRCSSIKYSFGIQAFNATTGNIEVKPAPELPRAVLCKSEGKQLLPNEFLIFDFGMSRPGKPEIYSQIEGGYAIREIFSSAYKLCGSDNAADREDTECSTEVKFDGSDYSMSLDCKNTKTGELLSKGVASFALSSGKGIFQCSSGGKTFDLKLSGCGIGERKP